MMISKWLILYHLPYREQLFKNIQSNQLQFDNSVSLSTECRDFLLRILEKDPSKRLGSVNGLAEIRGHPFFKGVDWDLIKRREQPPVAKAYLSDMAMNIIKK